MASPNKRRQDAVVNHAADAAKDAWDRTYAARRRAGESPAMAQELAHAAAEDAHHAVLKRGPLALAILGDWQRLRGEALDAALCPLMEER